MCECGTGLGCTPPATSPAKCAMSVRSSAPTSSAMARKRAKSRIRGWALHPATIIFGRNSRRLRRERVVVDAPVGGSDAIVAEAEEATREVHVVAVGEMPAMRQVHAHDPIARLEHGEIGDQVGRGPRVRLDVGMRRAEERQRAVPGQGLGLVDFLAAAVVALPGIALGVLVGEDRSHRLEHRRAREVLRGDHLQGLALALELALEDGRDRRVGGLECRVLVEHRRPHDLGREGVRAAAPALTFTCDLLASTSASQPRRSSISPRTMRKK